MESCGWLVLAAALLASPVGSSEGLGPGNDDLPGLTAALQEVAVAWEILDPRETRYTLTDAQSFDIDLDMLRRRYETLKGTPPLNSYVGLADRATVTAYLEFNRAYYRSLSARMVLNEDRADAFKIALCETDKLYKFWDAVRDVHSNHYYVVPKRTAIRTMIEIIGREAYDRGEFPPPVPLWYFDK